MQTTNEAIESVKQGNYDDYAAIFEFACNWVKNQFQTFTSEDLKKYYYLSGGVEPLEPRVYGAVFTEMKKLGLIKSRGFEISKNPKCHRRPQRTWLSLEYSKIQQQNRKLKQPTLNLK